MRRERNISLISVSPRLACLCTPIDCRIVVISLSWLQISQIQLTLMSAQIFKTETGKKKTNKMWKWFMADIILQIASMWFVSLFRWMVCGVGVRWQNRNQFGSTWWRFLIWLRVVGDVDSSNIIWVTNEAFKVLINTYFERIEFNWVIWEFRRR